MMRGVSVGMPAYVKPRKVQPPSGHFFSQAGFGVCGGFFTSSLVVSTAAPTRSPRAPSLPSL